MDVFRSNNPGLRTKYWEIKNTQNWNDKTKFNLKVDEVSGELLRVNCYKVHWLLDAIEFKMERGNGAQDMDHESKKPNGIRADGTSTGTNQTTTGTSVHSNRNKLTEPSKGTENASLKGLPTRTGNSEVQTSKERNKVAPKTIPF